jgi:hypothetical protein
MPVPVFTAGEILTAAAMNQVGLYKIAAGSLSLSTTPTNVTGVFDSTKFTNYRVIINTTARSTSNRFDIRYIVGTTPTSSTYFQAGIGSEFATNATIYMQRSNNDNQLFGVTGTTEQSMWFDIFRPNDAAPTLHTGQLMNRNTGFAYSFGGSQDFSTAFTGFQLFSSSGTITVSYQVLGYRD